MASRARQHSFGRQFLAPVIYAALTLAGVVVALHVAYPLNYLHHIMDGSDRHALDPALIAAVIRAESRFRPGVVSRSGAVGLMQVMPNTGAWIAAHMPAEGYSDDWLLDPEWNIALGTWYLQHLVERFGDVEIALIAYNAGPANAERWDGRLGLAYSETRTFVRRVMGAIPIYRLLLAAPWR